jgi:hypothetical protein
MSNFRIVRTSGLMAVAFFAVLLVVSKSSAQFQPKGTLGVLAPENLAKARPKAPFDLTGMWLHSGNERFEPPATVKLTPVAQAHFDAARKAQAEGKTYRNDIGLCWPAGVPIMMTRVWPVSMIQLPTSVFMIQELMNSVRVVYLDGRQHTDPDIAVRSFNGESVGRWEGNALVIETKNFVDEHHWINDRMGVPASDELRIIERITMPNPNSLSIEFTLIDPKGWDGEWKQTKTWRRVTDRDMAEVECLPDLNEHMPTVHSKDNVREDITKKK